MIKYAFSASLLIGLLYVPQNANAQNRDLFNQYPGLTGTLRQQNQQKPDKLEVKIYPWSKDVLIQKFLRDYFKTQPVYLVEKRMQELVNYGYLDQEPTAMSYFIGFMAEVFKQNPDKVLGWLNGLDITQYQAGAIIRAMRHAGMQDKVQTWLATKRGWTYKNNPSFHNLTPIDDIIADELENFEILTGAYAASGKQIYMRRFAEGLTFYPDYNEQEILNDPEKGRALTISQGLQEIILLIMYSYPQAQDQMKEIIPSQPLRTQQTLNKLLTRLETYQGPSSEFQGLPQYAQ